MFALIITLVSIALVVVLVAATVFYGGDIFKSGGTKAGADQILNGGSQISAAVEAYKAETSILPTTIDQLVSTNYMASPPIGTWSMADDYIITTGVVQSQCLETNRLVGITGIPLCTDVTIKGVTACCSN